MEITGKTFFFDWEVSLMVWLQEHCGTIGARLATFFTQFGEAIIIILIIGLIYWGVDKKIGKYLIVNILTVTLWGSMIKNIALRRRPYFDHKAIQCLRPAEMGDMYDISLQGFSFPSLHAANTITMFSLLSRLFESKLWKAFCWLIPLLVGISRFVIGVHYPTDVIFGWLFGLTVVLLTDLYKKRFSNTDNILLILLITGIPGFFYCKSTDFYTTYGLILGSYTAFLFEKKYVNFQPAKNYWFSLLRVFGGGVIFVVSSTLLKLPFSNELLESLTTTAFLLRSARYAVSSFIIFGLYPMCFRKGKLDL